MFFQNQLSFFIRFYSEHHTLLFIYLSFCKVGHFLKSKLLSSIGLEFHFLPENFEQIINKSAVPIIISMLKRLLSIKCSAYGSTDTGRSRKHNEDNIRLNPDYNLYMVADGMGGHQAGEVASKIAADTVESALIQHHKEHNHQNSDIEFSEVSAVTKAIEQTNININQANTDRGLREGKGMGTTIVGCWYLPEQKMSIIFSVGDSRVYSYHKQELTQITTDHSLLQLWKDKCFEGDEPPANVLTKALGPYPDVAPDVSLYPSKKGEKLLLCSDGLTTMVSDEEILDTIMQYENAPEDIPEQLIIKANLAGGEDNISVIIIDFT